MGSRLMHLALGKTLAQKLGLSDRFIVGSLLPDAVEGERKRQVNTHFIALFDDDKYKWFDSTAFYELYKDEIKADPLYLGYYFHLISDNVFRRIFYLDMGLISRRGDKRLFEEFYHDYNILNSMIEKEYSLDKAPQVLQEYSDIKINSIYHFDMDKLMRDIDIDLSSHYEGQLIHFDMDTVRCFVQRSCELCISELSAMAQGRHAYDRYDMAIENRYQKRENEK